VTYRLLLDVEVVAFLERLPRAHRQRLFLRLSEIREFPSRYSDYREADSEGRPVDVHICGRYAIKFWDDVNDRQVKVLDIHPADRAGQP
jgi:mRNA-degrading endonuclease RelE of RelBE toxin-antitoxin system